MILSVYHNIKRFAEIRREWSEWVQNQAQENLKERNVSDKVRKHWEKLAAVGIEVDDET